MEERAVATNKKAYYTYLILQKWEAGISLKGSEVKSIRQGDVEISDAYARADSSGIVLFNMHIAPYTSGALEKIDPKRPRRLLLHNYEVKKIIGYLTQKGCTLVPLKVYFKKGFTKIEIALCKGKRIFDKREKIKKRQIERETREAKRQ
ncbi:SsrA-binding protein [bacterium Unc6]|nr:SsrA-binding protein [bacterium Unc6]